MRMMEKVMLVGMAICLFACQSLVKNVDIVSVGNTEMLVCDESKVSEKRETKLSELIEDFQIIQFEDKEDALFKPWWFYFSDNYICVRQDGDAAKLFDKAGRFIANVGGVGQGPGEYMYVYDILVDEKEKCIYATSLVGKDILKYDMNGNFIKNIELGARLNKPRLFLQPDSELSLVQLCFKDRGDKFVAASVGTFNNDSVKYLYAEELASNMKNKKGENTGYDNETWAYRNTQDFSFTMTYTDTLYHYNSKNNEINACFTFLRDANKKAGSFFVLNELPRYYYVEVVGKNEKNILVDKKTLVAYETTFVNDFMGNMELPMKTQDGYCFNCYEPLVLKEKIEKHLASGSCPEEQVNKLRTFAESLKENDNNILLLGKFKK